MSARAAVEDAPRNDRVPARTIERRLWFALLAPMFAWSVAELVGVALIGNACEPVGDGFAAWRWTALLATNANASSSVSPRPASNREREPAAMPPCAHCAVPLLTTSSASNPSASP